MEESAEQLIKEAEQALVNEEWQPALERFNRALLLLDNRPNPSELAQIYNGKGVALLELGRFGEAVKALETALLNDSQMAGAYYNLGLAWENLGDLRVSVHNYNRAIELEPGDAEAYFRRGGVWFALEQYDKTIEDTGKAIELHTDNAAVTGPYIARGLAYHRLERYDEAIADYSHAVDADPRGAVEAYFYRSLVHMDRGEALPARADLSAYLSLTDDLDGVLAEQAREIIEELDKLE